MRFARGPDGFRVELRPQVDAFVRQTLHDFPELFRYWDAAVERLRFAGHHMGHAVDGNDSNRYAEIQTADDGPVMYLAWRVVGDTVTVVRAEF